MDDVAGAERPSPFLNTRQAGHYLKLTPRHLERLRAQGCGPAYRRHGRYIVYHIDDLDAWSRANSSEETKDG